MIAHPAMLDVSRDLVHYISALLHQERRAVGTPTGSRALTCWKQAVFALVWFRFKPNITVHGAAFGISQSTAYRYLHEVVDVLADQATRPWDGRSRTDGRTWCWTARSSPPTGAASQPPQ